MPSCGLKLDDETVRVAAGLRLGLDLCVPHECHCGFMVDASGVHSFVCKKAPGRTARHHAQNDLIALALLLLVFRLDALALSVIATATWLAGWLGGWVGGCLSQPVLYQND